MLELLDNSGELNKVCFTAATLDQLPHYGPNEINICAISDKQSRSDNQICSMNMKLDETLSQNRVETNAFAEAKFKELTDKLEECLNNLSPKFQTAVDSLKSHLTPETHSADNQVDRTMIMVENVR